VAAALLLEQQGVRCMPAASRTHHAAMGSHAEIMGTIGVPTKPGICTTASSRFVALQVVLSQGICVGYMQCDVQKQCPQPVSTAAAPGRRLATASGQASAALARSAVAAVAEAPSPAAAAVLRPPCTIAPSGQQSTSATCDNAYLHSWCCKIDEHL
jgi:hypothetical protein